MGDEKLRIEAWHEAKEKAPTADDRNRLGENVTQLAMELAAAREEHAVACVKSAVVYGWGAIAKEQHVSAKQIHMWQREYLPGIEDLSKVPEREMKREARRVSDIKRKLARDSELREQLETHEARMTQIQEALNVQ
ncbi:hypothetical protein GCM10020255_007960 [Rhodococcus baikonurensis]